MYTVQTRAVTAQPTATIRAEVRTADLVGFFDEACREIRAYLGDVGVMEAGPPLSIWHSAPGEVADGFDIETCIPVRRAVRALGRIKPGMLAGGTLAFTVHEGAYDSMSEAFDAVWNWTQAEDYEVVGPPRDATLVGPEQTDDPTEYRTEVSFPIRRRRRSR